MTEETRKTEEAQKKTAEGNAAGTPEEDVIVPEKDDTGTPTPVVPSFWNWFITFFIIDIPVAGLITLIVWSFSKNTDEVKRSFARARLLYRILFGTLTLIIVFLIYRAAIPFFDRLISSLQQVR